MGQKKAKSNTILQPSPHHDVLPLWLSPISAWGVSVCWLIWVHCPQLWTHEILWDLCTQLCVDTQCPWVPSDDADTWLKRAKGQSEVLRPTGHDCFVSLLPRVWKCTFFSPFLFSTIDLAHNLSSSWPKKKDFCIQSLRSMRYPDTTEMLLWGILWNYRELPKVASQLCFPFMRLLPCYSIAIQIYPFLLQIQSWKSCVEHGSNSGLLKMLTAHGGLEPGGSKSKIRED